MKASLHFQLLLFLLLHLSGSAVAYYRKGILTGTSNLPCDISNSDGELYTAINYLTEDSTTQTASVSLGGWIFPRGYLDQFYTIFSFHEPISFTIYSIAYSPNDFTIRETLGNTVTVTQVVSQFTTLQWFYIRSYIQYSSSTLIGGTAIWNSDTPFFLSNLSNTSEHLFKFTKSTLLFNIGHSNSNLAGSFGSIVPSCSVSRYLCTFSLKVSEVEIFSFRDDIQGTGIELLAYYDQFYTTSNPGRLMSYGKSEDALIIPTLNTNPFDFLTPGQTLTTDFINAKNNLGFTIQFSLKMTSPSFTSCRLLTIIEGIAYVDLLAGSIINVGGKQMVTIDFTQWIHIIVVIKYGLVGRMLLTAYNYHDQNKQLAIPFERTLRLHFGSTTNTDTFRINSLRIYSGVYLSSYTECMFSILSLPTTDCLICLDSYLIDFQNDFVCAPLTDTANTDFPFERAWSPSRVACPQGMIHDLPSSTTCRCRQQHYLSGSSTCLRCNRYCDGCTGSANNCITKDALRNASGVCASGTFDDGFNCLDTDQLIPDAIISKFTFANPTYISGILQSYSNTFDNTFLGLEGQSAMLFTFSYSPASNVIYTDSPIVTVILNSVEVISIFIHSTSVGKELKILILGTVVWSYYVHPNNATWYVVWSDLLTTTLHIHTNGMLYSKQFTSNPISGTMTTPYICIGSCPSTYTSGSSTLSVGLLNNRPFKFIANTSNPMLYDEQVLKLILLDATILANFELNLKTYQSSYLGSYASLDTPGIIMNFYQTSTKVSAQLKGFGFFFENTYASVEIGTITFPISFSTYIWIDTINSQTSLLSYTYADDITVEYYVVPSELLSNASIRICFAMECQDTEESKLVLAEANFLAILTIDLSPFSSEFLRIQFIVVCNYSTETLTFILARPSSSSNSGTSSSSHVQLGVQSEETQNYLIYLNRILLITGNSYFYQDFSDQNSCFLSLNNNPSTCIHPMNGYVLFEGTVLTEEECANSSSTTIRFVNENTKECIDSHQLKSQCIIINKNTLECLECGFGYYLPAGSISCQPCSLPCTSCIDSSTYCLTCYHTMMQIAPTCECGEDGYFINGSYYCQACDKNCDTCVGTASNCMTCAVNRIDPPYCFCDDLYHEDSISFECVPDTCAIQCSTCTGSPSNCETCKPNRDSPPQCNCLPNSYEISDGSCETCSVGTYYSATFLQCLPCELPCSECQGTATFCLACDSNLTLQNNKCYCQNGYFYIIKQNGDLVCAEEMDITYFTFSQNGNLAFVLEFTFEQQLLPDYVKLFQAYEMINVYLNDVDSTWYTLENARVNADTFSVDIVASKSFAATSGYATFLMVTPFVSQSEDYVLSQRYLTSPFKIKMIGPLIFPKSDSPLFDLGSSQRDFKSENPGLFMMVQGLQLLLYILNSLQPTVIILLLQLQLPPNLYSFLEMIGMYIYPDMKNYEDTQSSTDQYYLLDFDMISNELSKSESSNEFMFKRLGFLKSAFLTIPLICVKYISILVLMFFTSIWKESRWNYALSRKVDLLLTNQLITENEVNLLIAGASILIQISNTEEEKWTSRYGFYCGAIIIVSHLYAFIRISQEYRIDSYEQVYQTSNPFLNTLIERIKKKRQSMSKIYFLVQMVKKYLVIAVVYYLRNFQQAVCALCSLIFLLSAGSTMLLKPYLSKRSRVVKIIVDVNFFITWAILIKIASLEFQLYESQPFNSETVDTYYLLGYVVVFTLAASNLIYIGEQIFCFIDSIREYLRKRNANSELEFEKKFKNMQKFQQN